MDRFVPITSAIGCTGNRVRATQLGAKDHDYRLGLLPTVCTQVYPGGSKTDHGEGIQLLVGLATSLFLLQLDQTPVDGLYLLEAYAIKAGQNCRPDSGPKCMVQFNKPAGTSH